MKTIVSLACSLALSVYTLVPAAFGVGQPPELLSYQSYLVDANGVPLGSDLPANYDVVFSIYDASSGGSLLWSEQQTITVDNGYFSVLLGEGSEVGSDPRPHLSGVFSGVSAAERYVGISVRFAPGGELTDILPRLRLLASPYSFLAKSANQLVNSEGNPLITAQSAGVTIEGTLSANSFSGSGASITGIDAANVSAGTLPLARIPSLPASRVTSGTFADARIPSLAAGKITSGTFHQDRIPPSLGGNRFFTGNVGIGATQIGAAATGRALLAIRKPSADQSDGTIAFGLSLNRINSHTGALFLGSDDDDHGVIAYNNRDLRFGRSLNEEFTEHVRLASSNGNVGIGTDSPLAKLHVKAGDVNQLILQDSLGAGYRIYTQPLSVGGSLMFFPIDSNNQLLGSAAWLTRAGNWTNSSDERLKKDIEPFASALEKARQLRPVTYRFLQESDDSLKSIGFIAQEVEAIFPSLVSESGDHKGVAYAQFGVIAISAIQELSREVDDLRIKTAELEEELSRMETMERELANLQAAVEMLTGKIYAAGGEE